MAVAAFCTRFKTFVSQSVLRLLPFFIPVAMIAINIVIVVLPVGVEAVDTMAALNLALLPRRKLATRRPKDHPNHT